MYTSPARLESYFVLVNDYLSDDEEACARELETFPDYDPRCRPFWQESENWHLNRSDVVITSPYVFADSNFEIG
jgi:hypothetical protein